MFEGLVAEKKDFQQLQPNGHPPGGFFAQEIEGVDWSLLIGFVFGVKLYEYYLTPSQANLVFLHVPLAQLSEYFSWL